MTANNGALKGAALAMVNLFVAAVGIGAAEGTDGAFVLVGLLGAFPALATGVIVGIVAELLARRSVALRLAVLIPPAVAMVALLGEDYELAPYILPAAIPTTVCVLVLERWTRVRPPPPVPVARAV